MQFIGIDPGEHWTGVVRLALDEDHWLTDMRVLDMHHRSFKNGVNDTLKGCTKNHTVTCESFQLRDEGYNKWSTGQTLQLIGGLRYTVETIGCRWQLIPAGNPDKHLSAMGLARYIEHWQGMCPQPNHANWHHARSAWRVLGYHLLSKFPNVLTPLQQDSTFKTFRVERGRLPVTTGLEDLTAPPVTWHRVK